MKESEVNTKYRHGHGRNTTVSLMVDNENINELIVQPEKR